MKGRKSARGYCSAIGSVQSGPVQDANVVRVQVEALRQKRSQLAVRARMRQWLPQLDHATPLIAGGVGSLAGVGHEVRVVLGSHGGKG